FADVRALVFVRCPVVGGVEKAKAALDSSGTRSNRGGASLRCAKPRVGPDHGQAVLGVAACRIDDCIDRAWRRSLVSAQFASRVVAPSGIWRTACACPRVT